MPLIFLKRPLLIVLRVSGYFGDIGDGTHKGNVDDPRVSIIEVVPNEVSDIDYHSEIISKYSHHPKIRYWVANKGKIGQTLQVAAGAVTGKGQAPGELRMITAAEVRNRFFLVTMKFCHPLSFRSSLWKGCTRSNRPLLVPSFRVHYLYYSLLSYNKKLNDRRISGDRRNLIYMLVMEKNIYKRAINRVHC